MGEIHEFFVLALSLVCHEDVNGEKLTVKKWWIFGADFSRLTQSFSRFIRDINGEKNISRYWWSFSRLDLFHGLPPLETPELVRGLLGTGPPDPTLEFASPSPPQGSIWHRFNIDSTSIRHWDMVKSGNRCRINVEPMFNSTVGSGGPAPNKPLTIPREARDLISKIRSCSARSDLRNKQKTAENA